MSSESVVEPVCSSSRLQSSQTLVKSVEVELQHELGQLHSPDDLKGPVGKVLDGPDAVAPAHLQPMQLCSYCCGILLHGARI